MAVVYSPDLLVKIVQVFEVNGLKYVYIHCQEEDDAEKHQTYFTKIREEIDIPKVGEEVNVIIDGYQMIDKNPRGDSRVPNPTNGSHYLYFHSDGSKTEVNGKYKSYTYPDGHTGWYENESGRHNFKKTTQI